MSLSDDIKGWRIFKRKSLILVGVLVSMLFLISNASTEEPGVLKAKIAVKAKESGEINK